MNVGGSYFGVGVADQSWDPRINQFLQGSQRISYLLWNNSAFHSVSGGGIVLKGSALHHWKKGDRVGVQLNFFTREIHFFVNAAYSATVAMLPDVQKLWPIVCFYSVPNAVCLLRPLQEYSPPEMEEERRIITI